MLRPSKYDDLCTQAREGAQAAETFLVVIGGARGQGWVPAGMVPLVAVEADQMDREIIVRAAHSARCRAAISGSDDRAEASGRWRGAAGRRIPGGARVR